MDGDIAPSGDETRRELLTRVAFMRIDLLRAAKGKPTPERVAGVYDVLHDWLRLPAAARAAYKSVVAESLMLVAVAVQSDRTIDPRERLVVAISLMDAGISIGLLIPIRKPVRELRNVLWSEIQKLDRDQTLAFVYTWGALLRYRPPDGRHRRELFYEDLVQTLRATLRIGLPRRAEALANAFVRKLGPVGKIVARHFPVDEEQRRVALLLHRMNSLPPLPLSLTRCARVLRQVIEAPLDAFPLAVTESGEIRIGSERFGVTKEPF